MLLGPDDLPGEGWKRVDERTWRTGEADPGAGWAQRAREGASISGWRSFKQPGSSRWIWCQATPLASAEDVATAMTDLLSRLLRNLGADVEVIAEREVDAPAVPGAGRLWAHEQGTTGPRGDGLALYLAAQVGRGLSIVCAFGGEGSWDWPTLAGIASVQVRRVEGVLGVDG